MTLLFSDALDPSGVLPLCGLFIAIAYAAGAYSMSCEYLLLLHDSNQCCQQVVCASIPVPHIPFGINRRPWDYNMLSHHPCLREADKATAQEIY